MKCQIKWSLPGQLPAVDDNEAIALAQAFDPRTGGRFVERGVRWIPSKLKRPFKLVEAVKEYTPIGATQTEDGWAYPICEQHALHKSAFWRLLPLPGIAAEDQHRLVQAQAPIPVIEGIINAWPDQCEEILPSLLWHGKIDSYWSFIRWGQYVGIEKDGYIHT